jgi:hypothetical protein
MTRKKKAAPQLIVTPSTKRIEPTPYQARMLSIPLEYSIVMSGSKGGGKSFGIALLMLQHVLEYGADASCLYLRKSHAELMDFVQITREIFKAAFPDATYNINSKLWEFPNGGVVELGHFVSADRDLQRYWGRRRTLLALDEITAWANPVRDLDPLLADLKPKPGVHARLIVAGNAGMVGSGAYARRWLNGSEPWRPADCADLDGLPFIQCPSNWRENKHLDGRQFERALKAAAGGDKAKLLAWSEGDFSAASSGAYFDGVLTEANKLPNWSKLPGEFRGHVKPFVSLDYGSSSPSVALLCASVRQPLLFDGLYFPRGSTLVLGEWHNSSLDRPLEGDGATVAEQAEGIKDLCSRFGVTPQGCADDACFSRHHGAGAPSIAEMFRTQGVFLQRAQKGSRVSGWELMRQRLADARSIERPWLGVAARCEYFWGTVPYLERDPRYPDDLRSDKTFDHAADAARYALTWSTKPRSEIVSWNTTRGPTRAELEAEREKAIVV